jgi:hypothetical protein
MAALSSTSGWRADVLTVETSAPHAGAHPFNDQAALEFGDGADNHDDGPAQRSGGIDVLPETDILHTNPIQLVQHLKEVLHRAGNPVRSPDENNIEAAAAGIGHHLIETWPLRFSARKPVGILIDDLVAALSSHLPQIDKLRFRMLIDG